MCEPNERGSDGDAGYPPGPVILLGRGGSGTRLVSAFASQNGIFLGNMLNTTGDSVEWVPDLYELAIESTAAGVVAGSPRDAYWRGRLRRTAAQILGAAGLPFDAAWGWKLPETMLALSQVLRAFPGARIIHLVRHPVASALRRTHMTSRMSNPVGEAVLPAAYEACGLDPKDIETDEPYLHNAATWSYQVGNVRRTLSEACPVERVFQLRYEDVCANPITAYSEIAKFLGADLVSTAEAPSIDWTRVNEVDYNGEKVERIWSICGETAMLLGYCKTGLARSVES